MKSYSKKCWLLSCVQSFDLLALLSAFIWKMALILAYKRKYILTKNLIETRDLGKEG